MGETTWFSLVFKREIDEKLWQGHPAGAFLSVQRYFRNIFVTCNKKTLIMNIFVFIHTHLVWVCLSGKAPVCTPWGPEPSPGRGWSDWPAFPDTRSQTPQLRPQWSERQGHRRGPARGHSSMSGSHTYTVLYLKRPRTDQEEALGGSVVLGKISDHLHHQNILQLQCALHQHLQTVT